MSQSREATFQGLLARFNAFTGLSPEDLTWLSQRADPFHCSIGQELLLADRLPEYCYCLLEGRGRVLHRAVRGSRRLRRG